MTAGYLTEIDRLMGSTRLDASKVKELHQEMILDNAVRSIIEPALPLPHKYAEELVANCSYLLEMKEEYDARIQLDAAKQILMRAQYTDHHDSVRERKKTE